MEQYCQTLQFNRSINTTYCEESPSILQAAQGITCGSTQVMQFEAGQQVKGRVSYPFGGSSDTQNIILLITKSDGTTIPHRLSEQHNLVTLISEDCNHTNDTNNNIDAIMKMSLFNQPLWLWLILSLLIFVFSKKWN